MSQEQQIAALREEIRRAGQLIDYLRRFAPAMVIGGPAGSIIAQIIRHGLHTFDLCVSVATLGATACLAAAAIPAFKRRLSLHALGSRFAALTPEQRGEVLAGLQADCGNTRRMVSELARRYETKELSPANLACTRGDEPTPAEREP